MLADIWPTGYHAAKLARVQPGESVVIYGAGPVGLFAAYSAILKGASRVFVIAGPEEQRQIREAGSNPLRPWQVPSEGMGSGQWNVKACNRHLSSLIASGKAKPSFLVSHQLSLDEAPEAYKHFDDRDEGWTKVVLKPGASKTADQKQHAAKAAHANDD